MKAMVLVLLVPLAVCTACGKKEDTSATSEGAVTATAPASADASRNAPATAPATATPASGQATVQVSLASAAGSTAKGNLTVSNEGDAIQIRGEISGLAPGKHGFHVHEVGECSLPDFRSAGEHFNPTKAPYGEQLGDLPDIDADQNGVAKVDLLVKGPTLVDKDGAPGAILGKSLIVHAMPDDHKTPPSGGSGDRIACGVIR